MPRRTTVLLLVLSAAMVARPVTDVARSLGSRDNRVLLSLELGKSSFEDVMAALGKARYFPYEDADAVCYKSKVDHTIVVFASGAAGERKYLTDFTVATSSVKGVDPRTCTPSDRISRDLATLAGLRLGLSVKEIEDTWGKPTERHNGLLVYEALDQRAMTEEERRYFQKTFPQSGSFDMLLMTRIKVAIVDGHAVSFQVLYTVTT